VETYFLNFAQDPHAEEVAARENMVSDRTMKDLGNLVRAITLNSKIDESRDFAAAVQESVVDGLRAQLPQHPSRGTRTAPFVVLIGANMPSVLCEIAFVSHPEEELLLRSGEHRERIARGLLEGLKRYLTTLNRSPLRQLTASRPGATVDSRENRR
jgi:N-acetylmuramoyl-L-alanine amidase